MEETLTQQAKETSADSKITLSLDGFNTKKEDETITAATSSVNGIDDSSLTEEEKKMVDDFSKQIDITETNGVLQYGAAAQQKVADFSDSILEKTKSKDIDDIGGMLTGLVTELKSFKIDDKEDGFFTKLFKKGANKVESLKAQYNSASTNVEKIAKALEDHQITLMKDVTILDQLYEKNLVNFKEVTMYILAGYKKLDDIKKNELPALVEKAKSGKQEDAQALNDLNNAINRFEKRLHDLELSRMVSIQMAPQIRLVQNNNTLMIEKIQSTLTNTIPLWKSQLLIALGLGHSKEAIKAESAVNEMTNEMLKKNAENLHMATVETAKASERGIVDIETLTQTNKSLIDTLDEVKQIQEEGRQKRAEAQVKLREMEKELADKLSDVKSTIETK